MKMQSVRFARRGFTLLELLVVVAIMAIIAGTALVTYEGLESRGANSVSAYNINGVDRTLRQYTAMNRALPNGWDSLMFSAAGTGADAAPLAILSNDLASKLAPFVLTEDAVEALEHAGITQLWYASGVDGYSAAGELENNLAHAPAMPNRVFDVPGAGWGVGPVLAEGMVVARVNDPNILANVLKYDLSDEDHFPLVIALGFGNNSTAVKSEIGSVGMSEAPSDSGVGRGRYGRFIALVHLGEFELDDPDHAHLHDGHLVGVLDARGNHQDVAQALANGQLNDGHDH